MNILDRIKKIFAVADDQLDVGKRFELDRQAVTGTMSKFRIAREIATGDYYGIKFLDDEKTTHFANRFKGLKKPSEGEIAQQFDHPLIVKTFAFGKTTLGQQYILMEYINGPGLNTLVRDKNIEMIRNRLNLIRQMAEAINVVHETGFIHRDICPRNFICAEDIQSLKLIDFGLTVPNKPEFCVPGNRTGTPQYMAPEIVRRRSTDKRVDVFAFGVSAYRILTFEHPWGSTDTTGVGALAHDARPPTPITKYRPNLNQKLARAIHRCLEKSASERFDSCEKFLMQISSVDSEDE